MTAYCRVVFREPVPSFAGSRSSERTVMDAPRDCVSLRREGDVVRIHYGDRLIEVPWAGVRYADVLLGSTEPALLDPTVPLAGQPAVWEARQDGSGGPRSAMDRRADKRRQKARE